jgi:hypothetical protein
MTGLLFGLRGGQELRDLELGINIFIYNNKIVYKEQRSKTNQGGYSDSNTTTKERIIFNGQRA